MQDDLRRQGRGGRETDWIDIDRRRSPGRRCIDGRRGGGRLDRCTPTILNEDEDEGMKGGGGGERRNERVGESMKRR